MPVSLKEVHINNFKSIKDLKVSLSGFNVLVGANGTGKTNFIEFFKFMKYALAEKKRPYMPYIEWWSYRNIVWMGEEKSPIIGALRFDVDGHNVDYKAVFSFIGGVFRILSEKLVIDGSLFFEREGNILTIKQNEELLKANAKEIEIALKEDHHYPKKKKEMRIKKWNELVLQTVKVPTDFSNLIDMNALVRSMSFSYKDNIVITNCSLARMPEEETGHSFMIVSSTEKDRNDEEYRYSLPIFIDLINKVRLAIEQFIIMKHPSMKEIKSPIKPKKEETLLEDSTNLHNILYYWFLEKGGKLPQRIEHIISKLFFGIQIKPLLTTDGKCYIKIFEKGFELDPPSIPDGLYKILAILAAIELKPPLLAIDEFENSLYNEALEYMLEELRNSRSTIIVTTHSPLVVDIVKLEDLFITEKSVEGTVLHAIKDPDKMREKLRKIKITQSESWIYGELV